MDSISKHFVSFSRVVPSFYLVLVDWIGLFRVTSNSIGLNWISQDLTVFQWLFKSILGFITKRLNLFDWVILPLAGSSTNTDGWLPSFTGFWWRLPASQSNEASIGFWFWRMRTGGGAGSVASGSRSSWWCDSSHRKWSMEPLSYWMMMLLLLLLLLLPRKSRRKDTMIGLFCVFCSFKK